MNKDINKIKLGVSFLIGLIFLAACGGTPSSPTLEEPTISINSPTETLIPPTVTEAPVALDTTTPTTQPTEIETLIPSTRRYHSFAYDRESQRIIMVGGQSAFMGDLSMLGKDNTWSYDGMNNLWSWMNPITEPRKLLGSQMVYDEGSDRVITYGGGDGLGLTAVGVGDTWAYDYNTNSWEQLSDGPVRRFGARMAYDLESEKVIVFGGSIWGFVSGNNQDNQSTSYNETWVYDYNTDTWTNMEPYPSPPGRWYQPMAYHLKADRVIMWGGTDQDGNPVDNGAVWAYDYNTNTWEEFSPSGGQSPNPDREGAAMAYDAESNKMIMFGGDAFGSETWAYDFDENIWTLMDDAKGPAGALNLSFFAFVYDDDLDRVFLSGGNLCDKTCDYQEGLWTYDFNTNTWREVTP